MCSSHVDLLPESSGCSRSGVRLVLRLGDWLFRCGARLWQPYLRYPHPAGLVHGIHAEAPACGKHFRQKTHPAVLGALHAHKAAVCCGGVRHPVVGSTRDPSGKVVRQRIPHEGSTTFHDASFGDITVENKELEDQVLLKSDGLPTYNFANVVDDHLMGITHVVRGSEYLSSAPKYNLLYEAFGWDIPTYVHCSPVMRDSQHKMSKRHGDPSYEDLIAQGYLTPAVLNYVALLGWSPKGENAEREFFTLPELAEIFEISGISKSPAVFDIEKLRWMNAEYMKKLTPDEFFEKAEPWLKKAISNPAVNLRQVAALVQSRCEILSDLPERVDFIDKLPDYEPELYIHKKSKTNLENSLETLTVLLPVLQAQDDWSNEALYETLVAVAAERGVKNSIILWPLRVAVSGKASTPGGATELCALLGKEESLRRIEAGIALLRK